MPQQASGIIVALALAAAAAPSWASQVVENRMASPAAISACQVPQEAGEADPVSDREEALQLYEAMPQHCLKAIVIVCSQAAETGLLDLGQAAACSIGYEALLKRGFAGDFKALMAWWQRQKKAPGVVNN